jgi:hypothetical protein
VAVDVHVIVVETLLDLVLFSNGRWGELEGGGWLVDRSHRRAGAVGGRWRRADDALEKILPDE